jgi:hypothetical protein
MRSVLAVLAGLVVLTVAAFAIEAASNAVLLSEQFGAADPLAVRQHQVFRAYLLATTLLSVVAGGYTAALIAKTAKIGHAIALGVVEVVFTIGAMIAVDDGTPLWIWAAGILLLLPAAWAGGWLESRRQSSGGVGRKPALS